MDNNSESLADLLDNPSGNPDRLQGLLLINMKVHSAQCNNPRLGSLRHTVYDLLTSNIGSLGHKQEKHLAVSQ